MFNNCGLTVLTTSHLLDYILCTPSRSYSGFGHPADMDPRPITASGFGDAADMDPRSITARIWTPFCGFGPCCKKYFFPVKDFILRVVVDFYDLSTQY